MAGVEELGEEGSWEAGSSFKRARMSFVSGEYSGSDISKEEGCRQWERGGERKRGERVEPVSRKK